MKFFSIISLGCPKNLVDSEQFLFIFKEAGFEFTKKLDEAEIILINTCGFIQEAKEEAILTILETAELKGKNLKKLIVTGCLVKRYKESLVHEIPEVDLWLDLKDFTVPSLLRNDTDQIQRGHMGASRKDHKSQTSHSYKKRELLTPKHYAYLRVSDGCDNRCSYCSIPDIRGKHTSERVEDLLKDAYFLRCLGVKELIINAQDTSRYGYDLYGKSMLVELLKKIDEMKLFSWIRLLYLHPAHLTEEMIEQLAQVSSLLPYFDIPLQHINDDILALMNRKIDKKSTIKRLEFLRNIFPDGAIRTTFITGFPSEKRIHFHELEDFIKSFRFTRLGVFTFSAEEGTVAYHLKPRVSKQTAQNRKDKLMILQQSISTDIMNSFVGKTLEVLIDRKADDEQFLFEGRSYLDAPEIDGNVFIKNVGDAFKRPVREMDNSLGNIVKVKITDALDYDLIGEIE